MLFLLQDISQEKSLFLPSWLRKLRNLQVLQQPKLLHTDLLVRLLLQMSWSEILCWFLHILNMVKKAGNMLLLLQVQLLFLLQRLTIPLFLLVVSQVMQRKLLQLRLTQKPQPFLFQQARPCVKLITAQSSWVTPKVMNHLQVLSPQMVLSIFKEFGLTRLEVMVSTLAIFGLTTITLILLLLMAPCHGVKEQMQRAILCILSSMMPRR